MFDPITIFSFIILKLVINKAKHLLLLKMQYFEVKHFFKKS